MRKKFSRTLTFERVPDVGVESSPVALGTRRRTSVIANKNHLDMTSSNGANSATSPARAQGEEARRVPLDSRVGCDYTNEPGLSGIFAPIKNDFSMTSISMSERLEDDRDEREGNEYGLTFPGDRYRDDAHWTRAEREKVRRVRYVICLVALLGLALGLMSRIMLNVCIVEMVKRPDVVVPAGDDLPPGTQANESAPATGTTRPPSLDHTFPAGPPSEEPQALSLDPLIYAATDESPREPTTPPPPPPPPPPMTLSLDSMAPQVPPEQSSAPSASGAQVHEQNLGTTSADDADWLHFNWSKQDINIVLGAFYMGYGPGILLSGSVTQRYGAKWPLFVCVFGSALINLFTPLIAQSSLNLLIASRILLGIIQGSFMPCLYELFNRWLTQTESNIFAPLIKVSIPLGSLMGTMMPGIMASLRLEWPVLFYFGGALCLGWSLVWLLVATSLPQDNKLIGANELRWIMRKKNNQSLFAASQQQATITDKSGHRAAAAGQSKSAPAAAVKPKSTPWLLIITNPSVLALTVVKFTYNIALDFIMLQLAVYLRDVHNAPIETISAIASSGCCMQMLLIVFVGWLAKVVVLNQAFGLSVTKWRKLFQGGSNFLMALAYLALAYADPDLRVACAIVLLVCFFWMLGAGGESMVPYDLSSEYPASIVGFAHSVSILSGVSVTAACDLVVGENTEDPESWSLLFYLLAAAIALGGLIFVLVVKAKPFLPGEKVPETQLRVKQQQQVSHISGNKSNKLNGFR